mmetsp:Transcript_46499/g.53606  ORF Transcript_46499/g.53606 Transcript_46499/m.53606 type:complete len:220 (+) Transcript_46499:333-992(+)
MLELLVRCIIGILFSHFGHLLSLCTGCRIHCRMVNETEFLFLFFKFFSFAFSVSLHILRVISILGIDIIFFILAKQVVNFDFLLLASANFSFEHRGLDFQLLQLCESHFIEDHLCHQFILSPLNFLINILFHLGSLLSHGFLAELAGLLGADVIVFIAFFFLIVLIVFFAFDFDFLIAVFFINFEYFTVLVFAFDLLNFFSVFFTFNHLIILFFEFTLN